MNLSGIWQIVIDMRNRKQSCPIRRTKDEMFDNIEGEKAKTLPINILWETFSSATQKH
jgi:hypothetical protein